MFAGVIGKKQYFIVLIITFQVVERLNKILLFKN